MKVTLDVMRSIQGVCHLLGRRLLRVVGNPEQEVEGQNLLLPEHRNGGTIARMAS
jgi:hypothetical protein